MSISQIKNAIQAIQDETVTIKGLNNFEMRNSDLYWQLGITIKSYFENENININFWPSALAELEIHEKEIRKMGNTWIHPRNKKPPQTTWMKLCLDFVLEFEDKERWDLVARLSGNIFKSDSKTQFTQRYARDLLPLFSKKNPISDAEQKQKIFRKEIEKFSHKPSLNNEWRPLIRKIFGKDRSIYDIQEKIEELILHIDTIFDNESKRKNLRNLIGLHTINYIRRLLQLTQLNAEKIKIYKKKIVSPKKISTQHEGIISLYSLLYEITNNPKKLGILQNKTRHDIRSLDKYLKAIRSDDDYQEYIKNQNLLKSFFS